MSEDLKLPESLDRRFKVERELARGGFGVVWLARQRDLDRLVAIKVLYGALATADEHRRRFLREARATARLSHPNVVRVIDSDVDETVPWIAYEYVPGPTLADRLSAGPMALSDALDAARQIAAALEEAHGKQILHR